MKFTEFDFEENLLEGLQAMGFEQTTPIQEQAIPLIQKGKDIIACAQTGTGKTGAFLIPILNEIAQRNHRSSSVHTLVVVPTRELAIQIDQQLEGFAYYIPISTFAVYGGGDASTWDWQKKALCGGAEIIIGTPGRLLTHIRLGYVPLDNLECLILDEADRMLDMGFYDDIMSIVSFLPKKRQTLMFSATMPPKIKTLAQKLLQHPSLIEIAISRPAERINQGIYKVNDTQKLPLVLHILQEYTSATVLIFSSTKRNVKQIAQSLLARKLNVGAIHSDLEQSEREAALLDFKSGKTPILVATDVLSRGIDIEGIELVLNYDVPHDAEDYVHRIGRTARAKASGTAITLVTRNEWRKFQRIEKLMQMRVKTLELPEQFVQQAGTEERKTKHKFTHKHKGNTTQKGNKYAQKTGTSPENTAPKTSHNPSRKKTENPKRTE
ncbi:MAG: DEAD/DEAH box helicase [Chitinophagales bacterium]|nr:DEAD/DEAH box helicase [Bacteroidota bacterium]MCB9043174.1 DEAD/DEAH box helicase [Chitinophagales bacterium]